MEGQYTVIQRPGRTQRYWELVPMEEQDTLLHSPGFITRCLELVSHISGDVAEIGVWKGKAAELICQHCPTSTVYLFDTFAGMTPDMFTMPLDNYWKAGAWGDTSLEHVRQRLSFHADVRIYPGVFPASARGLEPALKFVHVDVDLYKSTLSALEWAWQYLVPGGIILDDDYKCDSCKGAEAAVNEFCKAKSIVCDVWDTRAILRRPV